ncbi:MAG: LpxI family protein [Paracoccaceae bacterium]
MPQTVSKADDDFPDTGGGVAIISGRGALPRLVAEACAERRINYRVVGFEGAAPGWAAAHPFIPAVIEKVGKLFSDIRQAGCSSITFAGGMARPRLNPLRLDGKGIKVAAAMLPAMKQGDDATLRKLAATVEAEGFTVIAPHEFLGSLVAPPGVLGRHEPTAEDRADAERAAAIVAALGAVDVGQAAVVAQGICLATESIQGTDRMLAFVADTAAAFRPDPKGAGGVLFKAPKPGQDRRVDFPAIGPDTVRAAAGAGLAGIAVEAGGVLVLGLGETVSEADRLGLFLWGRRGAGT